MFVFYECHSSPAWRDAREFRPSTYRFLVVPPLAISAGGVAFCFAISTVSRLRFRLRRRRSDPAESALELLALASRLFHSPILEFSVSRNDRQLLPPDVSHLAEPESPCLCSSARRLAFCFYLPARSDRRAFVPDVSASRISTVDCVRLASLLRPALCSH